MAEGVEVEVVPPVAAAEGVGRVESPPAVPQPERGGEGEEVRGRLRQLAERLRAGRGRRLLVEYLQLRRSLM